MYVLDNWDNTYTMVLKVDDIIVYTYSHVNAADPKILTIEYLCGNTDVNDKDRLVRMDEMRVHSANSIKVRVEAI